MFHAQHDGVSSRTLEQLDFSRVLERLADRCRTPLGAALAVLPRLAATADEARAQLALTAELRALADAEETPPLGGIADIRPGVDHAQRGGTLEAKDLVTVGRTLRAGWLLRLFAVGHGRGTSGPLASPQLGLLGERLTDHKELADFLLEAFDDHDELRDDASPELRELRQKKRSLHDRIRARIKVLLSEEGIVDHLQERYFTLREDRYVLPVRSGERAEVDGIIHGSSQTGHTLFIEPSELVPLNNELKLLEEAVRAEERRILGQLSAYVGEEAQSIGDLVVAMAELDHASARAALAAEMGASAPTLVDEPRVALRGARNPVLVLRGVRVVENDITLSDATRLLVISGPNAGGKTVTLSTLGLAAVMARAGLQVACKADSVLPFFGAISTVLGDAQDLGHDLSTFSGHLTRLVDALEQARSAKGPCLVLLDELAAGTEPEQGAALALAFLEAFADAGALGAVTTHYDRLKTLALGDPRFQNAAVGFDPVQRVPTYTLRHGNPGSSSACDVARRVGVPAAIVDRAEAITGDKTVTLEAVLARLETERQALEAEREVVYVERRRLQHERETLERKLERIEREGEALVREKKREALQEVATARETISQIVRELQRERDPRVLERRRVKIAETEKALKAGVPERETPKIARRMQLTPDTAVAGAAVYVPSLDREGRIEGVRGQNAVVIVGDLRLTVKASDLFEARPRLVSDAPPKPPPAPSGAPPVALAPPSETADIPAPRVASNTCDVRGMRADEAVEQVERFLDALTLRGEQAGYVLHGHGTGRLKVIIRERFQSSRYVRKQESAHPDYGGDAVTVMWLA